MHYQVRDRLTLTQSYDATLLGNKPPSRSGGGRFWQRGRGRQALLRSLGPGEHGGDHISGPDPTRRIRPPFRRVTPAVATLARRRPAACRARPSS